MFSRLHTRVKPYHPDGNSDHSHMKTHWQNYSWWIQAVCRVYPFQDSPVVYHQCQSRSSPTSDEGEPALGQLRCYDVAFRNLSEDRGRLAHCKEYLWASYHLLSVKFMPPNHIMSKITASLLKATEMLNSGSKLLWVISLSAVSQWDNSSKFPSLWSGT